MGQEGSAPLPPAAEQAIAAFRFKSAYPLPRGYIPDLPPTPLPSERGPPDAGRHAKLISDSSTPARAVVLSTSTEALDELRAQRNAAVAQLAEARAELNRQVTTNSRSYAQSLAHLASCDLSVVPDEELAIALTQIDTLRDRVEEERHNRTVCVVCMDMRRTVVLLPCKHQVLCRGCADVLQKNECPMCRQTIENKFEPMG
eukprot:TRINITY_DN15692_c0_g1_i1.p1 TRINITY_DN15692_c0_g1~~TRINITY_DN15692_c0_g1_i1.p1  ORF type:complete len:201 (+),score=35.48 TRINITY_DN15692_c0_g1_i1:157-759(+)